MRHRRRLAALALLCTAATMGTCVYPTERDSSVHVSITPLRILIRGDDTVATATAWQLRGPGDSVPIPNVAFVWTSSDPKIATVDNAGHITGVKSGTVYIRAAAANFDAGALAAADTLRVAAPLEIDSLRPAIARYGALVTAFGPGADDVVLATIHNTPLFPYPFSATRDAAGYGRQTFWLMPPAEPDTAVFIGNGIVTSDHDTTVVVRRDVYEPNDTEPHGFDLDATRPWPGTVLGSVLVFNPALFFEPLRRDQTFGADWYRLSQSSSRDLTIILTAPSVPGTFVTFVTDSLGWDVARQTYVIGPDSWTYGPGSHACHGLDFGPSEANGDSTVVAFKSVPPGVLHAIAIYTQAARYGLAVLEGYVSELPADPHEDDNSCNAADARGTATLPLRDTLTIENPHDIDWIRFAVPSLGNYQFRLHAFAGVHPDSLKDLDFYLVKVPSPGDTALSVVALDTTTASTVNQPAVPLTAGDYYAVVLDFAGTTTDYEICVDRALGACAGTAFPSPPATAAAAQTGTAPRRAQHAPPPTRAQARPDTLVRAHLP
jgi:hypothetical protein